MKDTEVSLKEFVICCSIFISGSTKWKNEDKISHARNLIKQFIRYKEERLDECIEAEIDPEFYINQLHEFIEKTCLLEEKCMELERIKFLLEEELSAVTEDIQKISEGNMIEDHARYCVCVRCLAIKEIRSNTISDETEYERRLAEEGPGCGQ